MTVMTLTRPGFSVYLLLGLLEREETIAFIEKLEPYIDFLEVGIPTSKPKYDGPTIRRAHQRAVSRGYQGIKALKLLPDRFSKPVIVMAYMEDHVNNLGELAEEAASAGATSLLLPDLAFDYPERLGDYVEVTRRSGLSPAFFASSKFPHRWLAKYATYKPLFIYLGLQPATGVRLPIAVERNVRLARRLIGDTYLLAGFAIRGPEQAKAIIGAGADGVVVGSAIIAAAEEGSLEAAVNLARSIHRAINEEVNTHGDRA